MLGIEYLGISAAVCEQQVSQQKELFRITAAGLFNALEVVLLYSAQLVLVTLSVSPAADCSGAKTLQCSCLSTHMVLILKIDENISPEQIL